MKKNLIRLILIFGLLFLIGATTIKAQTAESSDDTASSSATTSELKKRIEKVVVEKREQIKGVLQDLLSNKTGFIGEISRISEEAITVKSAENTTIIPIGDSLNLMQDGKPLELTSLEVGNWTIVLGNKDGEGIESEYLLVSEETLRPKNQLVTLGSITNITRSSITVITRESEEEIELTISKATKFEDVEGEEATVTDFEKDLNVLVVATEDTTDWELQTIRSLAPFETN